MNKLYDIILDILLWIREDYRSDNIRFCVEFIAWTLSIATSFIMMLTVPTPPFMILYPMWITGCVIYGWACYTRKSFGMLANYILLTTFDSIALIRMIIA